MLKTIKDLIGKIYEDLDSGNTNIPEEEQLQLVRMLKTYTDRETRLSKYKACEYLNMSRATFDNYVRDGIIPKGEKTAGFKELSWSLKTLDKFKYERHQGDNNTLLRHSRRKRDNCK